jgi:hypothetical protein
VPKTTSYPSFYPLKIQKTPEFKRFHADEQFLMKCEEDRAARCAPPSETKDRIARRSSKKKMLNDD